MTDAAAAAGGRKSGDARGPRWSLLFGNFAIGCGVMSAPGALNDLARSLEITVAAGGQLITAGAVTIAFGAPLLAAAIGHWDRRRLLVIALVWYAAGLLASAAMPTFAVLLPVRALTMLGAAVFTPQAAAAIGGLAPPDERGRAITFVFMGWSLASVLGLPITGYVAETLGWRQAFALVGVMSAVAAVWVARAMPAGLRGPVSGLAAWREVLARPVLVAVVGVTALAGAGQFTMFSYLAPYYRQVLGADAFETSALFGWFGAIGLVGNVLVSRHIDRYGAARAVNGLVALMALTMLLWPLGTGWATMALVLAPWAFACFASNSAQQARLGGAAPAQAPALMALNTSAIYLGQAAGAAGGGAFVAAHAGEQGAAAFGAMHGVALAWLVAALAVSLWAARRMRDG